MRLKTGWDWALVLDGESRKSWSGSHRHSPDKAQVRRWREAVSGERRRRGSGGGGGGGQGMEASGSLACQTETRTTGRRDKDETWAAPATCCPGRLLHLPQERRRGRSERALHVTGRCSLGVQAGATGRPVKGGRLRLGASVTMSPDEGACCSRWPANKDPRFIFFSGPIQRSGPRPRRPRRSQWHCCSVVFYPGCTMQTMTSIVAPPI